MAHHHTSRQFLGLVLAGLMLVVAGIGPRASETGDEDSRDYVFVFLKTGPTTDLTDEQQQEAFAGHFANMNRMAEAGDLLIAGPLGDPKSDPEHRGLFMLDVEDLQAGMAIAHTDPTTKLGVFVLEGFVFTTDAPLTELPRLEDEAETAREADPDNPVYAAMRGYMLVTAPFSVELLIKLSETEGVLIAGRLHGSGPDADGTRDDEVLAWLDATDAAGATEILDGVEEESEGWTVHGWYGSTQIAKMAE